MRGQGIRPVDFSRVGAFTQFGTWLSESGSAEGCPVNCTYCFFKLDGQTPKQPVIMLEPAETVRTIGTLPSYHPEMPLHFGSQTDAFATPRTIAHYTEMLRAYGDSEFKNPVVFITKREVPQAFLDLARAVPQSVVFYVSYSGLAGTELEPTVRAEAQRRNFVRLHEMGLPRVHYWRPFLPYNSRPEVIAEMLDFVSQYAQCSALNGLKLNDGIREHVAPFWPQLRDIDVDFTQTGEFWPVGVRDHIRGHARTHHPGHPLFFDTACSLAYVLGKPDIQGVYQSSLCDDSQCAAPQRARCQAGHREPTVLEVDAAAAALSLPRERVSLAVGRLLIDGTLPAGAVTYLRSRLRYPVSVRDVDYREHNWASSADANHPLIEVDWQR